MSRLFVAVWPPPEVLDGIEALHRPVDDGGRWTRRDQWHVTLRFLGSADVDEVRSVLAGVRHSPVEAVVGPATELLGEGVLHLPVAGLGSLADGVVAATRDLGRPPEGRRFLGHLTLARMAGEPPEGVLGQPFTARFAVDAFHLVSSSLGGNAARYETVATFPLTR
ncbi:MAG TPA: RNA 2',3'-cyclic phosphodiesterase [Acidimicrobiales bacterium]